MLNIYHRSYHDEIPRLVNSHEDSRFLTQHSSSMYFKDRTSARPFFHILGEGRSLIFHEFHDIVKIRTMVKAYNFSPGGKSLKGRATSE